ncbi:hypothetical protein RQCS_61990 (plasmid) [Rhodococcus qingshengii]|nr:hypothetical protein RQCS_61990 [Rhodococcus qingshengii]
MKFADRLLIKVAAESAPRECGDEPGVSSRRWVGRTQYISGCAEFEKNGRVLIEWKVADLFVSEFDGALVSRQIPGRHVTWWRSRFRFRK